MNNLDKFKEFVRKHPSFANYIKDGSMTWQKFYELYDMYGEDSVVWNDYNDNSKKSPTLNEILTMAKKIDMNKLQDGVNSLSKAVGLFSDLFASKGTTNNDGYTPRAIYRKFDD